MAHVWNAEAQIYSNEYGIVNYPGPFWAPNVHTQDLIGDSYARISVHQQLMEDPGRIEFLKEAFLKNAELFAGKVVLDVGCGVGFLSMLAAQAGASRVFGIEPTELAHVATCAANQFQRHDNKRSVISIIKGRVEDLPNKKLPYGVEQVDIIISEPVGFSLFHESTFEAVLCARDKWLKPGGILFPDKFSLYIAGLEDFNYFQTRFKVWDESGEFLGLDLKQVKKSRSTDAVVREISPEMVVTNYQNIMTFDLNTLKSGNLDFTVPYKLTASSNCTMHALFTFFMVEYTKSVFKLWDSTSPEVPQTIWKQVQFNMADPPQLMKGDQITGTLSMEQKSCNTRDIDFKIKIRLCGELTKLSEENTYRITML